MKSIISDLPEGSTVTFRTINTRTVETVYGHDDLYFSAVEPGRHDDDDCEFYPLSLVADWDKPLVRAGATFWLVIERGQGPHGHMEQRSAIAFQRPGIDTAEEAFAAGPGAA